jgi:hypothetical protein
MIGNAASTSDSPLAVQLTDAFDSCHVSEADSRVRAAALGIYKRIFRNVVEPE